jgi:hypothetical protein
MVPGFDPGRTDPARALLDARYPFARYAGFFASDLSRRAERMYGTAAFAALTLERRTAVFLRHWP